MAYFLLTGATGLLGRYLLRDITLAELPLAVVVRPTKWESAAQRIETAMAHWENDLGRPLVRPVILQGDIGEPGLGLNEHDLEWVRANCGSMIHSAASLTFHAEQPTGEPWRSNVQGTRNVLELCRRLQIRDYHHVSTAYVCGLRRGRVMETELDLGQEFGNDYEQTKITAEKEVLAASDFERVTIYRPSIIVGDSATGFTTSYHGFYTPLRLVYSLLRTLPGEVIMGGDWMGTLQLAGDERKNLVAVDWVSAAMTWVVAHPECHGKTYHLTNPAPATTQSMRHAMGIVLGELVRDRKSSRSLHEVGDDYADSFREQMGVYQSYWSDDPAFDSTNTQTALPHLPCPEIDATVLDRLVRFAVGANFGWPREAPIVPPYEVASQLRPWLAAGGLPTLGNSRLRYVSLHVSGPGGGQWHLVVDQERLVGAGLGLKHGAGLTCYLTSATFAELTRGKITLEESINSGQLVIAGNSVHPSELARFLGDLASPGGKQPLPKALIR
jgi:thioester reductase-like protein